MNSWKFVYIPAMQLNFPFNLTIFFYAKKQKTKNKSKSQNTKKSWKFVYIPAKWGFPFNF